MVSFKQLASVLAISIAMSMGPCALLASAGTTGFNELQQPVTKIVKGTVTDSNHEPLIGASVIVKGSSEGVITGNDGEFELYVTPGSVLVVSYIGFHDAEITVGASNSYQIVLSEDAEYLDDVVVIGFGTVKKANLTGSVSAVKFDDKMTSRASLSLATALTGMNAGLNIAQTSGTPGSEGFSILVRGQGTMNDSSPLVLVDGIPGAINDVNPADVESVSVLKDAASAAIYGSRAANGVILVTTKRGGEGKFEVVYNGYAGFESAAKNIEFISDMATHMELVNESEGREKYPQAEIEMWRSESAKGNPLYPNTDWYDEMLNTSVVQEHTLAVRGGTQRSNISMSLGFLDNKGIIDNSGFKKYSFRINANTKVTDWLELGGNVYGFWSDRAPIKVDEFYASIRNTVPGVTPKAVDGRFGGNMFKDMVQVSNPRAYVDNIRGDYERQKVGVKFFSKVNFLKYFQWETSIAGDFDNRRNWEYTMPYTLWNFQTEVESSSSNSVDQLLNSSIRYYTTVVNSLLRFNATVAGNHHISALVGYDQQYNRMDNFNATKQDVLGNDQLYVMDAATDMLSIKGNATDDALQSYFGRINYDYKGKYLLEANARYDGSSRFSKELRWGFFPSFSAGWRITEEEFAAPLKTVFDEFKFRASYGQLGNNRIGDYTYQSVYGLLLYPLGGQLQQAVATTTLANGAVKWETTTMTNIGFDFAMFRNRLQVSADWYDKTTDDILAKKPIPYTMGFNTPSWQNIAKMRNKGIEFEASWNSNIGKDFVYGISGNLSTAKNEVLKFGEDEASGLYMISEGKPYHAFYLLEYDHIIQDQAEIDQLLADGYTFAAAIGGTPQPGDLLYKDTNDDKVFNLDDRTVRDFSTLPSMTYGITLNAAYKGVDFMVMGQGCSGAHGYWGNDGFNTFNINEGFLQRKSILNRWTEKNHSTEYPRLRTSASTLNSVNSDYWLYNTSYFRIKSIQLGYTLPANFTKKFNVKRLRIYTNLENFFTFTDFEGYNPENTSMAYPLMKQCVFGINVTL